MAFGNQAVGSYSGAGRVCPRELFERRWRPLSASVVAAVGQRERSLKNSSSEVHFRSILFSFGCKFRPDPLPPPFSGITAKVLRHQCVTEGTSDAPAGIDGPS
eukprot:scaffold742_cov263-Pinguiococcus_pyrenoidosus.AAC.15